MLTLHRFQHQVGRVVRIEHEGHLVVRRKWVGMSALLITAKRALLAIE